MIADFSKKDAGFENKNLDLHHQKRGHQQHRLPPIDKAKSPWHWTKGSAKATISDKQSDDVMEYEGTQLGKKSREMELINNEAKLRFLRLLSPKTRSIRWQHSSWHHSGEFRRLPDGTIWTDRHGTFEDPPQSTLLPLNRGSMFKNVMRTSTDFIIHPDWV